MPLKEGDWFAVNYIAFDYRTGHKEEAHWEPTGGFSWEFRKGRIVKGWIPGLEGMRVGGKRELILPSRLAHNTGDIFYLIELLEVKPHT